jgi:hypothetical protein
MSFRRVLEWLSRGVAFLRDVLKNALVWLGRRSPRDRAVSISIVVILICFWKWHLLVNSWLGLTSGLGRFFLHFSQNHPHLSRILHVGLNVIPDAELLVLALAGLVYLAPSLIGRIEASKPLRRSVTAAFVTFALITVVVNAINREEEDHTKSELNSTIKRQTRKLDEVSSSNGQILRYFVSNKGMNEAERRENIEKSLRNEYILSHDPIDPEILSGAQTPPEEWMNRRLRELGESWTVSEDPFKRASSARQRSYATYVDIPRFTGSNPANSEGAPFQPGDPLGFNIHYKASGPNPIQVFGIALALYLEPNTDTETQKEMLATFTDEIGKERKSQRSDFSTMSPGDTHFVTAYVFTGTPQKRVTTSEDLEKLKIGTEIAFVISEITYKDAGVTHHERKCLWLQPPASPSGIWHSCEIFGKSD